MEHHNRTVTAADTDLTPVPMWGCQGAKFVSLFGVCSVPGSPLLARLVGYYAPGIPAACSMPQTIVSSNAADCAGLSSGSPSITEGGSIQGTPYCGVMVDSVEPGAVWTLTVTVSY